MLYRSPCNLTLIPANVALCVHFFVSVLLRIPSLSSVICCLCSSWTCCLKSYFISFLYVWVWKYVTSWEKAEQIIDNDAHVCLHVFVFLYIPFFFFFFFVGHGCFVNSCLRILACALGGETLFFPRFLFPSVISWPTHGWAGDDTSIVYVYTYYIQIWQPLKL